MSFKSFGDVIDNIIRGLIQRLIQVIFVSRSSVLLDFDFFGTAIARPHNESVSALYAMVSAFVVDVMLVIIYILFVLPWINEQLVGMGLDDFKPLVLEHVLLLVLQAVVDEADLEFGTHQAQL